MKGEQQVTLRFAVRDSGIGISPEEQNDIFSPFFQADVPTTRRCGGTGLGLTISRQLVAMMGGEIGVISSLGHGSEFWFTLTFDLVRDAQFSTPEVARLHILFADDNQIARDVIHNTANGLGWTVSSVSSGEAAVQYVLAQEESHDSFDVIILDWKMPGMDGFAAARAIREAHKERHDPIIIVATAHSHDEICIHPDRNLVDAVLNKPVTTRRGQM
ncbi:MAG: response regulator [Magnetococcales bacterium]|nr:response regulator [Magnetococcales bacterium]